MLCRRKDALAGKRLKICIYARYSTDEQDESSIADQYSYCLKFLKSLGLDLEVAIIEKYEDPETSGETVFRPGINQVRDGVNAKRWDILICEDVGRLFRNLSACCDLVETAFDNGIRIIAINDDVDSDEPGWEDRFYEAAQHHAKTNRFTSHRIKRKFDGLWEMGAAVGPLRPGYIRIYPEEEFEGTGRRRRKKPKFDEIDPKWKDLVYQAFEKIAAEDEPLMVANWLTKEGLPKCNFGCNQKTSQAPPKPWFDRDVLSMIRNPIYRGHEVHAKTTTVRKKRSGKKRQVRNDPDKIRTREMPHLRIVPDWLWFKANEKIDERMNKKVSVSGDDHPLANLPRNSRFPLSKNIICDCCEDKMWADGRNEGGYRCKHAKSGECWNKATAVRDFVHRQISRAVSNELLALDGILDTMVAHIGKRLQDDAPRREEEKQKRRLVEKLDRERLKLGEAIATFEGEGVPVTLLTKLQARENDLEKANAELECVQQSLSARPKVSESTIRDRIKAFADQLLDLDRSCGPLLARLIDGKIRAVPHLQFGSTKVVLRAEFVFRPVGILPDQLLAGLSGEELEGIVRDLPSKRIVVDLFEPSHAPKHAMTAVKLSEENPKTTLEQLGKALGISKRSAHLALQLGRKMREEGIEDPYIRLTERPTVVARWS